MTTRFGCLLLVLLATAAAAPRRSLPVPPIPPDRPPTDQSAPIPNWDAKAPTPFNSNGMQVDLRNYRVPRPRDSYGYTPGSEFRNSEDKRPIQTPGLMVRVPVQLD